MLPAMLALILSIAIAVIDQATKYWVLRRYYPGQVVPVIDGWFNLVLVRNTGAAWGIFGGFNIWLALLSAVMLVVLVVFRRQFLTDSMIHRVALGLMLGGISGNLIDRVKWQYVVDFLDFHRGVHHFPSFNVADAAICVGVGLYVLTSFFSPAHPFRGASGTTMAGGRDNPSDGGPV